jgi:hypothetical protein
MVSIETKEFKVVYTYRHADFHCGIESHFHYGIETLIRHADYRVYLANCFEKKFSPLKDHVDGPT